MQDNVIIENIKELITLAPLVRHHKFTGITQKDLGRLKQAWLAIENGQVVDYGQGVTPSLYQSYQKINAKNGLVMPGLVDCHTHPVYGGNRADEFSQRLAGATYKEIASAGGGIKRTVKLTRQASEEELTEEGIKNLRTFLKHGVTTVEAKSGYGLSIQDELKLLRAIKKASNEVPQCIEATLLALHAIPEDAPSKESFIREMTEELLPQAVKEGLANWVDAFIEEGYFTKQDTELYFKRAKELGLGIRVHADEFTNQGAGAFAAMHNAASADHLEYSDDVSISAMAKKGVVAVLLPGTSLYTGIPYTRAKPFLDGGCPVALATDFNPGSCRVSNLGFIATIGGLHCGLDLAHTVAAVTWVAARALRKEGCKGALAKGMDADVIIYPYSSIEEWAANLGQIDPFTVLIKGRHHS